MKQYSFYSRLVFALAITASIIGFSAFSQKQQKGSKDSFRREQYSQDNDTSGKRSRDGATWNFDGLDEQMKQFNHQMENLDIQIKNLDLSKFQGTIDEAMKKVDFEKITEQINESVKKLDWNISNEVIENIQASKLEMVKVKEEMEHVKATLEKQKAQIKLNGGKIKEDVEKAMKNAKRSMEGAREKLKNTREFTDDLEKDGLINKSKAYKIEVKNGELYIDGKKQSKEISDKYRRYYRKMTYAKDKK